ncbi:MAG: hypothetical protein Q7T50_02495, partial [Candidatus Magasanikbacteria bacterium]|nr:hypothetical protein [Candidatus Magasanikbacteria bacterium]
MADILARFCVYFFVVIGVQLLIVFNVEDGIDNISKFFGFVFCFSCLFSVYFYKQAFLIEGLIGSVDEIKRLETIRQECISYTGYLKKESGLHIRIGIKIYSYLKKKDREKVIKKVPREIKLLEGQNLKAKKAFIFWKKLFDKT